MVFLPMRNAMIDVAAFNLIPCGHVAARLEKLVLDRSPFRHELQPVSVTRLDLNAVHHFFPPLRIEVADLR